MFLRSGVGYKYLKKNKIGELKTVSVKESKKKGLFRFREGTARKVFTSDRNGKDARTRGKENATSN
jgi:hypothetical protein